MKKSIIAASIISLLSLPALADLHEQGVIDYQGKKATQSTIDANAAHAATLNFADTASFERANKNLIAPFDADTNAILRDKFCITHVSRPDGACRRILSGAGRKDRNGGQTQGEKYVYCINERPVGKWCPFWPSNPEMEPVHGALYLCCQE